MDIGDQQRVIVVHTLDAEENETVADDLGTLQHTDDAASVRRAADRPPIDDEAAPDRAGER